MRPLNNYIIVRAKVTKDMETQSGIYIPQTVSKKNYMLKLTVMEVNKNCKDIKVGDKVLVNKKAMIDIPDIENQFLVREEDVYAIIVKD